MALVSKAMRPANPRRGDAPAINVLALNSGSSSLKFGLYRVGSSVTALQMSGAAEGIGDRHGRLWARDAHQNELLSETGAIPGAQEAITRLTYLFAAGSAPDAIGHRIVHGGPALRRHCLIDGAVMQQLESAAAFAPLHAPAALAVIRFALDRFPGIPQVACFDTAFHGEMPDVARVLPIAKALRDDGIQRYGFHGLSCESIVYQLASNPSQGVPERLVIAHLGNGVSVTAVKNGTSIDTSMGLTPTGGAMMGTRSGDLDPGILLYLMREKKFDAAMIENLVDHDSGLKGVSGVSSDMRQLRKAASSNTDARLAIEMFCYSVCKQIAAMTAALDGLDVLVFTGGIGEHDADTRAAICEGLCWFGVNLDGARNRSASNPVSDSASRCSVYVLDSLEDERIARHTWMSWAQSGA
jgi:acetate kinase